MKIAIDCRMLGMSGIGVYIENVIRELVREGTSDHYLLLGDPKQLTNFVSCPNVTIVPTTIPIFSLKELCLFPVKQINQCDRFYTPNFNIPGGIKVPVYATIHDVIFLDIKNLTSPLGRLIRWWYLRRAVRKSKTIFTVSEFTRKRILFHFPKTQNIIVTYCAVTESLRKYTPRKESPFEFSYLLFIGNIKRHKGLALLMNAYNQARKSGLPHKLVIIGSIEEMRTRDKKIKSLLQQQNSDILFTGKIDNNSLYELLAHTEFLVLPSVYEGFGLPPLEALYLGKGVLLSNIEVLIEIYGDLPVQFFRSSDVNDLAKHLFEFTPQEVPVQKIRTLIDIKYHFKLTANKISSALHES